MTINFQYGIDDLPPDLLKLNKSFIDEYFPMKSFRNLDLDPRYRIISKIGENQDQVHTIITGWRENEYSYEDTGYHLCAKTRQLAVLYNYSPGRSTVQNGSERNRGSYLIRNVNEIPSSSIFCIK